MALPTSGIEQSCFAKAESAYGAGVTMAAGDAVSPIGQGFEFDLAQEWHKNEEHNGSASPQPSIRGKRSGTFTGEFYAKPIAAASQPDVGPLILASGFSYAANVYSFNSNDATSLQLFKGEGLQQEIVNGAVVDEFGLKVDGTSLPVMSFKGPFASHGSCLGTIVVASGSGTTLVIDSGDAWKITPGARLTVDGDDNSSAGFLVTAVASDGVTLTVGSTLPSLSGGEAVIPYIPSVTTGGTILGGVDCGLTIGGASISDFISLNMAIKTGNILLDKTASSDRAVGVVRGMRELTGTIKFYLTDATAPYAANWEGTLRAISLRVGANTTARRWTYAWSNARIKTAKKIETPGTDASMYEVEFDAFQSSSANDEFTMTLD